MPDQTVAIIPCTNQKANAAGPARDVWQGAHFQLVLAHAEMFYDDVRVMSFKYGLIKPTDVIEPYDINIKYASAGERLKWWAMLRKHIQALSAELPSLVALYVGSFERDRIIREFVRNGTRNVIIPFEGQGIGNRMSLVYDCVEPFDQAKLKNGDYALPENFGEPPPRGRPIVVPPDPALTDDEVEWED